MTLAWAAWRYYLASLPTLARGVRGWPAILSHLNLPQPPPFAVELRPSGLRFNVRSLMDIWLIKETCLDRQYERVSVPLQDGWTIVDIGAGIGAFAIDAGRRCPRSHIHAFEPLPQSARLLRDNLALNGVRHVQLHTCAVTGTADDSTVLYTHRSRPAESTTSSSHAAASSVQLHVLARSLDGVLDDLELATCDYLKVDCEGAEHAIFGAASHRTWARLRHVCLEYHTQGHRESLATLVRLFEQHGFRVRLSPNPVHATIGLLYAVNDAPLETRPRCSAPPERS